MKSAPFELVVPSTLDDVLDVLAGAEDAKVLAGGQSLLPSMAMRLARPAVLVDLGSIPGLDRIDATPDEVVLGALVRHRRLERPGEVPGPLGHLLAAAARVIGHLPIRTRGTFGGSLAHADPAAEWCLLAVVLGARLHVGSTRGRREVGADDFFQGTFTTALEADEVLHAVSLPRLGPREGVGFAEISRRAGDFAIVSAAAVVTTDDEGVVTRARVGVGGVGGQPLRLPAVEDALVGGRPTAERLADAAAAGGAGVDPYDDVQASGAERRVLVRAMLGRCLAQATGEAPRG